MVMRRCSVAGCHRPLRARGVCSTHYWRLTHPPTPQLSVMERFERNTMPEGDCVVWIGTRIPNGGYGTISIDGRQVRAHRLSWELHNGAISDGLSVCHTCDNPPCVRIEHLWLGSQADNLADMVVKGRHHSRYLRGAEWHLARQRIT